MTDDDEQFERRLAESKALLVRVNVDVPTVEELAHRRTALSTRRLRIVLCVSTVLVLGGISKLASESSENQTFHVTGVATNQTVVEAITSLEQSSTGTLAPTTEPQRETVPPLVIPPPNISADLQVPLCRDLAPLVEGLVNGPLVPVGARTRKAPGQPDVACEILYAIPGQSPEIVIGRMFPTLGTIPADCIPCHTTRDADEVTVTWATGSKAFIDPTGADDSDVPQDASVLVDRIDGTILYVSTYGRPNADEATAIASAFDQRLG